MYHLFVTNEKDAWVGGSYEYDLSRFCEYTAANIKARLGTLSPAAVEEIKRYPAVFAYEKHHDKPAQIGWLDGVQVRLRTVRITYHLDKALPAIPENRLEELSWDLNIEQLEMHRTHWAIKDVELFETLRKAGLLAQKDADARKAANVPQEGPYQVQLQPTIFKKPDGEQDASLVSLMMPFHKRFEPIRKILVAACEAGGMKCQRADDLWIEDVIINEIFALIYRSRYVICDFTDKNPNVMYEAGMAHTLGRTVIPIAQSADDVPFDLRHRRFFQYMTDEKGLKELQDIVTTRLNSLNAQK